MQKKVKGIKLI